MCPKTLSEYCVWYTYNCCIWYCPFVHGVSIFDWGTLYHNIVYMIAREQYIGLWQKVGQHSLAFCITAQSLIKSRYSFTIYLYIKKSLRLIYLWINYGFYMYDYMHMLLLYTYIRIENDTSSSSLPQRRPLCPFTVKVVLLHYTSII